MTNFNTYFTQFYTSEFFELLKTLNYPFLKTTRPHESLQHLNEILKIEKDSTNLIYLIFDIDHFSHHILKLKGNTSSVKNLPDGIIFNKELGIIQSQIQFKTHFTEKPLTNKELNKLNTDYTNIWVDSIKVNFYNYWVFLNQEIDPNNFPRIEKNYITEQMILKEKSFLYNMRSSKISKKQNDCIYYMYELMKIKYNKFILK